MMPRFIHSKTAAMGPLPIERALKSDPVNDVLLSVFVAPHSAVPVERYTTSEHRVLLFFSYSSRDVASGHFQRRIGQSIGQLILT